MAKKETTPKETEAKKTTKAAAKKETAKKETTKKETAKKTTKAAKAEEPKEEKKTTKKAAAAKEEAVVETKAKKSKKAAEAEVAEVEVEEKKPAKRGRKAAAEAPEAEEKAPKTKGKGKAKAEKEQAAQASDDGEIDEATRELFTQKVKEILALAKKKNLRCLFIIRNNSHIITPSRFLKAEDIAVEPREAGDRIAPVVTQQGVDVAAGIVVVDVHDAGLDADVGKDREALFAQRRADDRGVPGGKAEPFQIRGMDEDQGMLLQAGKPGDTVGAGMEKLRPAPAADQQEGIGRPVAG